MFEFNSTVSHLKKIFCRRLSDDSLENGFLNCNINRERLEEYPEFKETNGTFDPHNFGKEDGISPHAAVVHILRSIIGASILLMPYLMKNMGYVTTIVLMISLSLIYYHSVHILMSVEYALCKIERVAHLSFVGVAQRIFTQAPYPINKSMGFVQATIYIYYGVPIGNTTSIIVLATNIQLMAKYLGVTLSPTYIMTILIVPLTIFCLPRQILKLLEPLSSLTNFCTFLIIAIVIGFSVIEPAEKDTPKAFVDLAFIPQGTATFLVAIRCTGLIIPLKNEMVHPKKVTSLIGVLNVSALTATALYIAFGLIVYVNLKDSVEENVLSNLPTNSRLVFFLYFLYSLALIVGYILQFFLRFETIWSEIVSDQLEYSKYKTLVEYAVRIGINLLGYLLAIGCPCLALVSAISGTIGILVEIVLPSVFQLLLMTITKQKSCWLLLKNVFIIGFSSVAFAMSAWDCVFEVKKLYLGVAV